MEATYTISNDKASLNGKKRFKDRTSIFTSIFVNCASFIVSVFFIYTGIFKLLNAESFMLNVSRTGVFPAPLIQYMPYVVAATELAVAFVVIMKTFFGHILFASTMIIFSFYITYLNNNQLYEICGCGGVLNGLGYPDHMLINMVFTSLSFAAIFVMTVANEAKTKSK